MENHKPNGLQPDRNQESHTEYPEVRLGQLFHLFPQDRMEKESESPLAYISHTKVITPTGEPIVFYVSVDQDDQQFQRVTPFNPHTSYTIDNYDFEDKETAIYKFNQWKKKRNVESDPLKLYVADAPELLSVSDETLESLRGMRLQIAANGFSYLSDNQNFLQTKNEGYFTYNTFYPMDFGKLPHMMENGFELGFPNDLEKIQSIQAKFVLPR